MVVAALAVAAVSAEYFGYLVFETADWFVLRFFVPAWPFLAIGATGVAIALSRLGPLRRFAVPAALVVGGFGFVTAVTHGAFGAWAPDRRYPAVALLLREVAVPNSVVFSSLHTGSLRYYSGVVPIRMEMFDGAWLDRSIDWLDSSGVHAYAVLEADEVEFFRTHFANQRHTAAMDAPLITYTAYGGGLPIAIFDLTTPPAAGTRPRVVIEKFENRLRSVPPGPLPRLTLPGG
jgi:hypothetical protein